MAAVGVGTMTSRNTPVSSSTRWAPTHRSPPSTVVARVRYP